MTNLQIARVLRGLSTKQLADAIGDRQQHINSWERDVRIKLDNAVKIADVLDVEVSWLIGCPQIMPVYNPLSETTAPVQIIATMHLEHGALYTVIDRPCDKIGYVLWWMGQQYTPLSVDHKMTEPSDLKDIDWIDSERKFYTQKEPA